METRQQVYETVCRILAKQLEIEPEDIHEDTRVVDDLGADSLDIVELTMTLEERYNIIITNDRPRSCRPSARSWTSSSVLSANEKMRLTQKEADWSSKSVRLPRFCICVEFP